MFISLWRTFKELWHEQTGRLLLIGVIIVAATETVFNKIVEDWSIVDSLYFTVITLTTVGYGDLHPTTDLSKLFTVVFVISGVSFILGFLNYAVQKTVARVSTRFEKDTKDEGSETDGSGG